MEGKSELHRKSGEFVAEFDRLWSQNPAFLGKALQCHLLLEWALTRFLKASCPLVEAWDAARLSFSQKLALATHEFSPVTKFKGGIRAVNKLRNILAHQPDWDGHEFPDLAEMRQEVIQYLEEQSQVVPKPLPDGLALVELFTRLACPFIAGAAYVIGKGEAQAALALAKATEPACITRQPSARGDRGAD